MDVDSLTLEHLSRDECLQLLASVPIGRIVYTRQALPAVELVNFSLLDGDIVIKTDARAKLAAATSGAVVAFQADSTDVAEHVGWSVTILGYARAVIDSDEIHDLEQITPTSWVPERPNHFIRISPTIVHGRRLGAPQSRDGSYSR